MKYVRCEFGHYYDPSKYRACPHCSARRSNVQEEYTIAKDPVDERIMQAYDLDYGQDEPIQAPARRSAAPAPDAAPVSGPAAPHIVEEESVTVARVEKNTGINPPVGWLVQIAGPNRGQSYEIHSERNTLGRSSAMDICLKGDVGVSRDTNGVISYNPRNRAFHLIPGEGKAIIYLNGEELLAPMALTAYDRIEISDTSLLFLPLCSQRFAWEDEQA